MGKKEAQRIKELEAELQKFQEKINDLERLRAQEKASLQATIEKEILEREKCLKAENEANAKLNKLQKTIQGIENERDVARENEQTAIMRTVKLEKQLEDSEKSHEQTKQLVEEQKDLVSQREKDIAEMKRERRELEKKTEKLSHTGGRFSEELTAAVNRGNELEMKLLQEQNNNESTTQALRTEIQELEKKVKEKQQAVLSLKNEQEKALNVLNKSLEDRDEKIGHLEEEMALITMVNDASDPKLLLKDKVMELQHEVFTKSEEIVKQGEKHLALSNKLLKVKQSLSLAMKDLQRGREILLRGIAGEDVDESLYKHVHLEELIRLRLQALENELILSTKILYKENSGSEDGDERSEIERVAQPLIIKEGKEALGSIGKLEREMRILRSRNKRLQQRSEQLESELQTAVAAMDDVRALKGKTAELAGRQRNEKDLRIKNESELKQSNEKILVLSEHIEKLMVHLKHEAAAKAKALEFQKKSEREIQSLRTKTATLKKKNAAKERIVTELQEGSKILEDQLRLMDEKYIELRTKLDWTRSSSQKEMKILQEDSAQLRAKWQLAVDLGQIQEMPSLSSRKFSKTMNRTISEGQLRRDNELSPLNERVRTKGGADSDVSQQEFSFQIPVISDGRIEKEVPWSDEKTSQLHFQAQEQRKRSEWKQN